VQQDAEIEKFTVESDASEVEAEAALALLDNIEVLSAELDEVAEVTSAVEDYEVRGC
jgi:prophage DNA circulation protein